MSKIPYNLLAALQKGLAFTCEPNQRANNPGYAETGQRVIWLKASVSIKCDLAKWCRLHASLGPFGSTITYTSWPLKLNLPLDHILANKTNLLPQVHPVLANVPVSPTLPHFQNQMLGSPCNEWYGHSFIPLIFSGFTLNKIKNIGRSKNQRLSDTASLLISFGKTGSAVNKAASRWSFT